MDEEMKDFLESLHDGFTHITEVSDPELLASLRSDGIQVDSEGYYTKFFGTEGEYELRIEPFAEENQYYVSLYKLGVLLTEKLPVTGIIKKHAASHNSESMG
jgi:hypothetical protein